MDKLKKRMTAQRKLELFLEAQQKDANLGEILRRYGAHLNDLKKIEGAVKTAAIEALKWKGGGVSSKGSVSAKEYNALLKELACKEQALAELTVQYALLKKNERLGLKDHSKESMFTVNGERD